MDLVTLRIKKIFFDKILKGEKKIEYRSNTVFYRNLFSGKPKELKLHYQGVRILKVKIRFIKLINKPNRLKDSPYLKTNKVFAIYLENPILTKGE